ncbi:HET-domain-containing protein [Paraphaeosphaeria sporulosa]|uniref:HET-domain-containing protein n=1 Tax=Paraphaeosphaeria sporulosa TaxID=1460663 RepID=A0A177CPU3_9PLEO|nr:HET-domain-containing protein [Paraphaeosphaeria sporulosa]OAG08958.1 HET-domain-containing protein [Paraphaeosphaeria sporulosa]
MRLCNVCVGMLRGGKGDIWTGTHDLTFEHHKSTASLRRSRKADCMICVVLAGLYRRAGADILDDRPMSIQATIHRLEAHHHNLLDERTPAEETTNHAAAVSTQVQGTDSARRLEELRRKFTAVFEENISIEVLPQNELREITNELLKLTKKKSNFKGFRLDFDIEKRYTRTFLLKPINYDTSALRTPKSTNTSSDEVFERACDWIAKCDRKCDCSRKASTAWYPKRLLDLEKLSKAHGLKFPGGLKVLSERADLRKTKVHLIDGTEASGRYVTLSHCWGKPKSVQGQLRLTGKTERKFRVEGIELRELPKSFRDAMLFASRLEHVRYIWIDSLCILQPAVFSTDDFEDKSEQDWREQSRVMGEVYSHSYLNISATAAKDGDQGLFVPRRPEYLWENEINVNYTGTNSFGSEGVTMGRDELTRCNIIDLSFWSELVDQAPVNQRGWVLQERLLAPRVLHFCHNQIAWECGGFQDVEGYPDKHTTLKVRYGDIIDEGRLKDLDERHGLRLRDFRLKGSPDPDKHMPKLGAYELWKCMVEVYSRTRLTVSRDKLIALSGIAQKFFEITRCEYVAGMWREHLESQLLWQVNELYRDGVFENPAHRDALRSPSFSWAAIDTPHGITYGEVTDYGRDRQEQLLFEVTGTQIEIDDRNNPFGLIRSGQLRIKPRYLRQIILRRLEPPWRVPYGWRLRDEAYPGQAAPAEEPSAEKEQSAIRKVQSIEHYNLNLDAPESDVDVFARDADLYCMPAAFGDRTVKKHWRDLICLLLIKDKATASEDIRSTGQFRRIGITRLSSAVHWKSHRILTEQPFDGDIILN